ncbi:trans-aconitate 2-methyltransferase [Kineococcus sp. TBRC 1896]|uniref:Trans-aconitate 2-methyltransferase n=1 Tax=Kineococcus mangrovi TaxID=1660183 RepID=A0ABV4I4D9_9ACTN
MTSTYGPATPFVHLFLRAAWQRTGPGLVQVLADSPPGRVLDLGSGTGAALPWIAAAAPGRDLLAVEPEEGLRAVLLALVAGDDGLRPRVTVLDGTFPRDPLPTDLAAVVVGNALGHFDPAQRDEFWRQCAQVLPAGGRVLVDVAAHEDPSPSPEAPGAVPVQVGRRRYEAWATCDVTGLQTVRWRMRYQVLEPTTGADGGDRVIEERVASYDWWVVGPRRVRTEAAAHGLVPAAPAAPEGCLLLEKGRRARR